MGARRAGSTGPGLAAPARAASVGVARDGIGMAGAVRAVGAHEVAAGVVVVAGGAASAVLVGKEVLRASLAAGAGPVVSTRALAVALRT